MWFPLLNFGFKMPPSRLSSRYWPVISVVQPVYAGSGILSVRFKSSLKGYLLMVLTVMGIAFLMDLPGMLCLAPDFIEIWRAIRNSLLKRKSGIS